MSRHPGVLLFLAIIVLDQLTKWLILRALAGVHEIVLAPVFKLVLVWNPGISFGMLGAAPDWGRSLLVLLTLAIGAGLVFWLLREVRTLPRLAIWAVLAGAAGNLIDRLRFGAVVDFLDLHVQGYHWPAFNVADSAIVLGAIVLIIDGFVLSRAPLGKAQGKG